MNDALVTIAAKSFRSTEISDFKLTRSGPYSIETYPIGSCIVDSTGYNCLSGPQGQKFTSRGVCEQILAATST